MERIKPRSVRCLGSGKQYSFWLWNKGRLNGSPCIILNINECPSFFRSVSLFFAVIICCGWVQFSFSPTHFFKLIFLFMCWNTAHSHVFSRLPDPVVGVNPVFWKSWDFLQEHFGSILRRWLGRAQCRRGVQTDGLWLPTQHLQLESVRPQNGSDQPQRGLSGTREVPGGVPKAHGLWCSPLQWH